MLLHSFHSLWLLSLCSMIPTTAFVISSSSSSSSRFASRRTAIPPSTTSTRMETVDTSAQYTPEQLQEALQDLLHDSNNPTQDGAHLYAATNSELSKLQEITATVCLDYRNYQQLSSSPSLQQLEEVARAFAQAHGPLLSLQQVIQQQAPAMALAAEFKRASPSKGRMAPPNTSAAAQGARYAQAGAQVLSVLTEPRWFQGSLQDLTDIRLATCTDDDRDSKKRPAILRKDFVVNEYMIAQAAAAGADTVLLIVAVLPLHLLQRLLQYARDTFQMEPLVEVHTTHELQVALQAGARVIGVNNRNLHTFQMDLQTSERMAECLLQQGIVYQHGSSADTQQVSLCALSGMSNAMDVHRYRQVGIGMCLIGESLMRASDPVAAIQNLCLHPDEWEAQTTTSTGSIAAYTAGTQMVKVCGITNSRDALQACQSGANLIGIIFAEKSPRQVSSMEQASDIVQTVRQFGERSSRLDFMTTTTAAFSNPLLHLTQQARILAQSATPQRPAVVGVFQNQSPEYIRQVCEQVGLDVIQLHGSEGMAAANRDLYGGIPVVRVVDIPLSEQDSNNSNSNSPIQTLLQSLTNDPMAILLDTAIPGQQGGTGQTFDWQIALELQNQGLPVLVAGGLTPENVADCVTTIRPFGVDVSSGVEASKGVKDHSAVEQFVQQARQAARDANRGF